MNPNSEPIDRSPSLILRLWRRTLIRAVAMQGVSALIVFSGAASYAATFETSISLLAVLFLQGACAALLGLKFGLDRWWLPIQLLLPPAVLVARDLPFPSWTYGVAFITLLLVFWNSADDRVPLYLTNRRTWATLGDFLSERGEYSFVDLGSGLGGLLSYLARRQPRATWVGVESAPLPFAISWLGLRILGRLPVDLLYGDIWRHDLASHDIVYCFLSPAPMPALFEKAKREMRPGSLFISNSFAVPGFPADEVIAVDDRRQTVLHVWRMGE